MNVRHAADYHFWYPMPLEQEQLIVSAGVLNRDYDTLAQAVKGMDVTLETAGFSPWVDPRKNILMFGNQLRIYVSQAYTTGAAGAIYSFNLCSCATSRIYRPGWFTGGV